MEVSGGSFPRGGVLLWRIFLGEENSMGEFFRFWGKFSGENPFGVEFSAYHTTNILAPKIAEPW